MVPMLMLMLMFMAATAFAMVIMMVVMIMSVVVAIIRMAMIRHRTIRVLHPTIGQMGVVVMVAIDGKCLGGRPAEQPHIFRALAHRLRRSPAADMTVQADHGIGFRHHHMQVMRD